MSVAAQNVIDALKNSHNYIPRVHRWTHNEPCLAITLTGSGNILDLAAQLVDGGLYTDYLAELGRTMKIDMTSIGLSVGIGLTVYWPQLRLEPEQIAAMAGRIVDVENYIHIV
jgi:hypothetical protein